MPAKRSIYVRVWFDELAKGGRGHFTAEKARSNLHSAIAKLRMIIDPDGEMLRLPGQSSRHLEHRG
jgi:hypothetical protein